MQLEELKLQWTRPAILEALQSLPGDLDQAYDVALSRIPHDLRETMFRALVVIGFFPEPLNLESVAEAVVMDPMRSMTFDSNWRLLDPAKSLLDYLGSFISVAKVWNADAWSAAAPASPSAASISTMASSTGSVLNETTAELAHSSVKEFVSARWDRIAAESHGLEGQPTATPTDHIHGTRFIARRYEELMRM